jgi:uridine kinase
MKGSSRLNSPLEFSETLFERMKPLCPALEKLAFYEFRYAIEAIYPEAGWDSVKLDTPAGIERMIRQRAFYDSIQTRPREKDRIVLDESINRLTLMLFVGLVEGEYHPDWVNRLFYFDLRGFYFLPRTVYFTEAALTHLGGKPFRTFEPRQKQFDTVQDISYLDFLDANQEIDQAFLEMIQKFLAVRGSPVLITLAGPTAAGKTEIVERMIDSFEKMGKQTTTIEMDNFLLDREFRENKPMGRETTHFGLFKQCLTDILQGRKIAIPRYDSLTAMSSHDLQGNLRPGFHALEVDPADVVFLEGNFPFQMDELAGLISLKVVYLTDDPIRLKRKWKRDVDYRKSYDPAHFRNRFFKTQFQRAEDVYRPQIEKCDIAVDTTSAAIWATPEMVEILQGDARLSGKR